MDQKSSPRKRAWRVLQKNLLALLGAAEWPYLGVFVAATIARALIIRYVDFARTPTDPIGLWRYMGPWARVGIVLSYFFSISVPQVLAFAGVSVVTWENCRDGNTALSHGLLEIRRRVFPLIALSFLVGSVATLLGGILPFVGPFIVQTIFLPAAVIVLILEKPRLGLLAAWRAGFSLTANSLGTIFGVCLASAVASAGLFAVLYAVRMNTNVSPVFFTFAVLVSYILIVPPAVALVLGIVLTLSYYDEHLRSTALPEVTA